MLSRFDDYPIHQTPDPVNVPASSDRDFYERYWFNGYTADGRVYFGVGAARYPHLGICDCAVSLVVDGVQYAFHASDRAGAEPSAMEVGPFRLEIVEPMRSCRVTVEPNRTGWTADLLFEGRTANVEEPRHSWGGPTRKVMDTTRFTQFGRWTGTLTCGPPTTAEAAAEPTAPNPDPGPEAAAEPTAPNPDPAAQVTGPSPVPATGSNADPADQATGSNPDPAAQVTGPSPVPATGSNADPADQATGSNPDPAAQVTGPSPVPETGSNADPADQATGSKTGRVTETGEGPSLSFDAATTLGTKDRSWGIRPLAGGDRRGAPARSSGDRGGMLFLWAPLHFDDVCVHYQLFEDSWGRRLHGVGAWLPVYPSVDALPGVEDPAARPMSGHEHRLEFPADGVSRMIKSAVLALTADDDGVRRQITLEKLFTFRMKGLGYSHPTWGHGLWKGRGALHSERWPMAGVDDSAYENQHVQHLVRAKMGRRRGLGVLEQHIVGPYHPYGLIGHLRPA